MGAVLFLAFVILTSGEVKEASGFEEFDFVGRFVAAEKGFPNFA